MVSGEEGNGRRGIFIPSISKEEGGRAEKIRDSVRMRSQVFSLSANTTFLRQALPLLVKPYKSILSPTPLTSASASKTLLRNTPLLSPLNLFPINSLRNFTSRATHVNDAGSVDLPLIQSMHNKVFFPTHNKLFTPYTTIFSHIPFKCQFSPTDKGTTQCRICHREGCLWRWSPC